MKTIFRFFNLALLLAAFTAVGTTASFAQDACADVDGQTAVYTKFTELYPKTGLADRKAAVEAGKQFLEKYGACESVKEQADYLKGAVPKMEEIVKKIELAEIRAEILKRFDAGIQGKRWDEAYAAGNEFVTKFPNDPAEINIIIPLGEIGLIESYAKNTKYNDDTIKFAKKAIGMLKGGAKPKENGNFGVFQFEGKKDDVLSDLNYTIGYITYYEKKDKKGALPYYYEVSQTAGRYKNEPRVYATIGSYYLDEAAPVGKEIAALIEAQKSTTDTDEVKLARETEIKGKVAIFNAYADRALDAFGRAYSFAGDGAANKTLKEGVYKQLQTLYESRMAKKDGLDAYIASTVAKPMPNPSTEVKPDVEPEPVKPDAATTTPAATTPATTTKPAATTPVKPAATPQGTR